MTITTRTINTTNAIGKHIRSNCKPVYCITDGVVYASVKDAAEANETLSTYISLAVHGHIRAIKGKKYCLVADMHHYADEIADAQNQLRAKARQYDEICLQLSNLVKITVDNRK